MSHHESFIGRLVNQLFGPLVLPLMEALGAHPHDPQNPIPDHIGVSLFICGIVAVFCLWFRRRLSVESPGNIQLCFEQLLSNDLKVGVYDLVDEIIGHGGRKYAAMIGTVGIYVLICNSISLIPGIPSPTAHYTVPLGLALAVFLYYHYCGIQAQGPIAYGRHFMGPMLWMAILMLPIELVSHTARLLSLTVRLLVNMVVSELLYVQFLGLTVLLFTAMWQLNVMLGSVSVLAPLILPPIFIALHAFVAFMQAFVFTILPTVYVGGAVAEEH